MDPLENTEEKGLNITRVMPPPLVPDLRRPAFDDSPAVANIQDLSPGGGMPSPEEIKAPPLEFGTDDRGQAVLARRTVSDSPQLEIQQGTQAFGLRSTGKRGPPPERIYSPSSPSPTPSRSSP